MTSSDLTLLSKKIAVGLVLLLVSVLIIFGGLWTTQYLLWER